MAYRVYVTEGLKAIAGNTAKFVGGVEFRLSFMDILTGNVPKEETRTREEVINHMKNVLSQFGEEEN